MSAKKFSTSGCAVLSNAKCDRCTIAPSDRSNCTDGEIATSFVQAEGMANQSRRFGCGVMSACFITAWAVARVLMLSPLAQKRIGTVGAGPVICQARWCRQRCQAGSGSITKFFDDPIPVDKAVDGCEFRSSSCRSHSFLDGRSTSHVDARLTHASCCCNAGEHARVSYALSESHAPHRRSANC